MNFLFRPFVLVAIGAGSAALAIGSSGCSDSSGATSGGDPLFDAGPAPVATSGDGGGVLGCAAPDAGTDTTWTGLYRDYFGPTGGASCSGPSGGSCHQDTNGAGYASSNFLCGTDKDACFTGITNKDAELLVAGDSTNPSGSGLVNDLRKATAAGTNNMPQSPICEFSDADIKRIEAWIAGGLKND